MRLRHPACLAALTSLATAVLVAVTASIAAAQPADEAVPPGDPVVRGNGALTTAAANDPSYGLWALVAVCLIAAGVLLISIERWEARRISHAES